MFYRSQRCQVNCTRCLTPLTQRTMDEELNRKHKYLDKLAQELVFQMTGEKTDDVQHPNYQIAYYYLSKAATFNTK
jgi:organic radical activating enzyme